MQEIEQNGVDREETPLEAMMRTGGAPVEPPQGAQGVPKKRVRKPATKKQAQVEIETMAQPGRVEHLKGGLSFGARTLTAIENLAESWGVTPATVANVAIARGVNLLVEEDATRQKGG